MYCLYVGIWDILFSIKYPNILKKFPWEAKYVYDRFVFMENILNQAYFTKFDE